MKSKTSNGNGRRPQWRDILFILVAGAVVVIFITPAIRDLTGFETHLITILSTWVGIAVSLFIWQIQAAQGARDVLGRSSDKIEEFRASGNAPRLDIIQAILNAHVLMARSAIEDWRDIVPDDVENVTKQRQEEMTMAVQPKVIRGKIARVLNSREVALNIGDDRGVETGMFFDILSPNGLNIADPDTGEALGSVDLPKTRVQVTHVYGRLAVASTYRAKRVDVSGANGPYPPGTDIVAAMFRPPKWETRYETLRAGGAFERDTADMSEDESFVKTGDPVVQVAGE